MREEIYQFAVLKSIEHLQVTFALTAFKVGDMLPEAIDTSECQEPVRVNLPCVPVEQREKNRKLNNNQNKCMFVMLFW